MSVVNVSTGAAVREADSGVGGGTADRSQPAGEVHAGS